MTLLILKIAAIWSLAVGAILYAWCKYHSQTEKVNDFQDNPPVMWDEIPYNLN